MRGRTTTEGRAHPDGARGKCFNADPYQKSNTTGW